MKRISIFAAGCLAVVVGVLVSGQQTVSADGAIVIKNDGLCGMVGSDASGGFVFGGIGQIETEIENGNKVMIKCKGDVINESGRGQNYDGFPCGIQKPDTSFVVATSSHAAVSASGVGTLTCTYRK